LAELDYNKYFEDSDQYMNIIIDRIKEYDMLDSIYFNDGGQYEKLLKLKEIQKDISVCLSNEDNIKNGLKELKGSKRIIYDIDEKKIKKKRLKMLCRQDIK
jgi:small nuclear ribonucleoprotein (snRNP)-like protein